MCSEIGSNRSLTSSLKSSINQNNNKLREMSEIQQNINKSNEKLAQLLNELKQINNNIIKKKDFKAIDYNINNKYKSKVGLMNKMKICSIIANNKQIKSNLKNNSK
jgi:hypothetical protein